MLEINFSPFPVLETERLLLRCVTPGDAKEIFKLKSDPEILKWVDKDPFEKLEQAESFIKDQILSSLEKNDGITWAIELKEQPGKLIGITGFWRLDKEHYRAEVGYMLDTDYWNKGIGTEAVRVSVEWLFLKTSVHSIEANINTANTASGALLRAIGFKQEAHFTENFYYNGKFLDSIIYCLVNKK